MKIFGLFVAFTLICFALSPRARAVCQDGCDSATYNTFQGNDALTNNITGIANTALGWRSLYSNTIASYNTAVGAGALALAGGITLDSRNTAVGALALLLNTGLDNTAVGTSALLNATIGDQNTAVGSSALVSLLNGVSNTAVGFEALSSATATNANTALGAHALHVNTTGDGNTATGIFALYLNDTGGANTADGVQALQSNTTGCCNTAIGWATLIHNETGSYNSALGLHSLEDNVGGDYNTAIGQEAGSASLGSGNIYIGAGTEGAFFDSGVIRIGDGENIYSGYGTTFIQGIFGQTIDMDGVAVYVDSDGQLGTMVSSRRFKKEIKPMDKASEAILALKPVTFHYKSDHTNRPQFGLVAEEVAEVNPDLVVRDKKGEIYTVRYEQLNAMLLNEFLKEHHQVQELKSTSAKQEATIAELKSTVAQQQKGIEALTAGLQKVSAQLEASKPAPQVVKNTD
jgi:trimeric autotransporter adhesin